MRISDWSSDVCSSDLKQRSLRPFQNLDARNNEIGSIGGQCGHGHVGIIGDHARRTLTHRNLTNAVHRHNVIVLRSFVTEAKSENYRWHIGKFTDPSIPQNHSGNGYDTNVHALHTLI